MPVFLLSFLSWLPALLGWGLIAARFGIGAAESLVAGELGMLAFGLIAILGNLIHICFPLTPAVSIIFWSTGLVGLLTERRSLGRSLRGLDPVTTLLVLALIGFIAVNAPPSYDNGLYHLQTIKWYRAYRLLPGLANLHGRLGINNSWFTVCAILWLPGLGHAPAFVGTPLLTVYFILALFARLRLSQSKGVPGLSLCVGISYFFFLPFFALWATDTGGDQAVFLGSLYLWYLIPVTAEERGPAQRAGLALILASFLISVKASAMLDGAVAALIWWLALRPHDSSWAGQIREYYRPIGLTAVGIVVWLIHGLGLSGCLLFPVGATCFSSLPWAVSKYTAAKLTAMVISWARLPKGFHPEVLSGFAWVPAWWERTYHSGVVQHSQQLALAGLAIGAVSVTLRKPRRLERAEVIGFVGAISLAVVALLFWFLSAPLLRFIGGAMILAVAAFIGGVGLRVSPLGRRFVRPVLEGAFLFALSFTILIATAHRAPSTSMDDWPPLGTVAAKTQTTENGTTVYTPITGDQCWDLPLPCTPYFNEHFRLSTGAFGPWMTSGLHREVPPGGISRLPASAAFEGTP